MSCHPTFQRQSSYFNKFRLSIQPTTSVSAQSRNRACDLNDPTSLPVDQVFSISSIPLRRVRRTVIATKRSRVQPLPTQLLSPPNHLESSWQSGYPVSSPSLASRPRSHSFTVVVRLPIRSCFELSRLGRRSANNGPYKVVRRQ